MITTNINVTNDDTEIIDIGRQGEYNVKQIVFALDSFVSDIGSGTAALVHYPDSGEAYIVPSEAGESGDAVTQNGTTVTWTVGRLATQYSGFGTACLEWVTNSGLRKSNIYKTRCSPSINGSSETGSAQQSFIDQMAALTASLISRISEIGEAVTSAVEQIQATAEEAADEAAESVAARATAAAVGDISDARDAAITAVNNAKDSAEDDIDSARASAVQSVEESAGTLLLTQEQINSLIALIE